MISISDPDAGTAPVQVTLTSTAGTSTLSGTSGLIFSLGDGVGDGTMTFSGEIIQINAALNGLSFAPSQDFNGTATLRIITNDLVGKALGGPGIDVDDIAINVNPANDAPVNSVPGSQATGEDIPLVLSAAQGSALSVADDCGTNPIRVSVSVTSGVLSLSGTVGLAFTVGDGTADPAMTFTGTLADLNAALDGLTFTPSDNFGGGVTLQIVTNDLGNLGTGGAKSDTDNFTITVNALSFNFVKSFDNDVEAIVPANDGSGDVYVGGTFLTYRTSAAPRLIRLNADGSVDPVFAVGSGFNDTVYAVATALDGSGDVYIGGAFTSYKGVGAGGIVRLNSDGTRDGAFNIGSAFGFNDVFVIVPVNDGSGDLLVGGYFNSYQGVSANHVIRLNADGSRDATFLVGTGFDDMVYTIAPAVDGSGDIYFGGRFTTYQGIAAGRIIRLDANGSRDAAFAVGSGFNLYVESLAPAVDGSGDVYAGGWFSNYQGLPHNHAIRLNSDGSPDAGFATGSGFEYLVHCVAMVGDGSGDVYVGGSFTTYQGSAANRLARLNADGSVDPALATGIGFDSSILTLRDAGNGSGDIYVGGHIGAYQQAGCGRIIRLNADGSPDPAFVVAAGLNESIMDMLAINDGTGDVYAAGWFTRYQGQPVHHVLRLNRDGSPDSAFDPGTGFETPGIVNALAPAPGGAIYAGGDFQTYQGIPANRLVRLNADGSRDPAFDVGAGFDYIVFSLAPAIDGSGDVYVGGYFSNFQGLSANRIIRLNSDGSRDTGFVVGTGFNFQVVSILPVADGSGDIYFGGAFQTYQGAPANGLVRIHTDGSINSNFAVGSGFDNMVWSTVLVPDGSNRIYVGGWFANYQGVAAAGIIRLNPDGSRDGAFSIGTGFQGGVDAVALVPDGTGDLHVGGGFFTYQGVGANRIIRLNADGSRDNTFNIGTGLGPYVVYAIIYPADTSRDLVLGGLLTSYQTATIHHCVRLAADGSMD